MDDETSSLHDPTTEPAAHGKDAALSAHLVPAVASAAGSRNLRDRATAGAAALGAAALLVLSFGPAALALSPSDSDTSGVSQDDRVWVSPLASGAPMLAATSRAEDEDEGIAS